MITLSFGFLFTKLRIWFIINNIRFKREILLMNFIDFCSGIGGGRLGLEQCQMNCVAHSEINSLTDFTYELFFGDNDKNYGDIMKIDAESLPDFDLMIAGFPCQTFSIAGKREGFCDSRGLIVYGLIKILVKKNVPFFIMENVKGLVNHNKGKTLNTIITNLSDAGYKVQYKVLNSENYGVPQFRERVYIVGIRKDISSDKFLWPNQQSTPELNNYLIDDDNEVLDFYNPTWQKYINNKYNLGKYDFNEILNEDYLVIDWRQSDLRIYRNKIPTLRNGRHGILYVKNRELRKLSGYEALLLQGFPKELADRAKKAKINNSRLLSQAGNAMTVSVIQKLGLSLLNCIEGNNLVLKGSQTAKNGFNNEKDIADKFNNWKTDDDAKLWLEIMNYNLDEIEYVKAVVLSGYKADINVAIQIKLKDAVDTENIQVKLVSSKKGFNQVDKRWLAHYKELWNMPDNVYKILQYFTGEILPYIPNTKDNRRMFLNEMDRKKQDTIIKWFDHNKTLILSDIIKGRGKFSAEWVLVVQKTSSENRWVLKNVNEVLQHYSDGETKISPRGSINIGRITVQRKGGDGGRETANMLQFKLDPTELFNI